MEENKTNNEGKMNQIAAFWTLLALLAASIEPIIVKMGYRGNLTPFQLLVVKTIVAGVVILPITRKFVWVKWHGIKRVASVSVLLLFNNLFTLLALQHVSVVVYLTLITTVPSFIAIINMFRGKEKIGLKFWAGFFLCFVGVLLSLNVNDFSGLKANFLGIMFVLASMLCTIIYRIRMEGVTAEFTPIIVSLYIFWINTFLVSIFFMPFAGNIPKEGWYIGIWIGIAAAVANVAFLAALHLLGSTRISIFNILQRPMVMVAAAFILHEPLTWLQILGIVMVMYGVNVAKVQKLPPKDEQKEEVPNKDKEEKEVKQGEDQNP